MSNAKSSSRRKASQSPPHAEIAVGVNGETTEFPKVSADEVREAFETGRYPYTEKMGRRSYEAEKAALQAELLKVQLWA